MITLPVVKGKQDNLICENQNFLKRRSYIFMGENVFVNIHLPLCGMGYFHIQLFARDFNIQFFGFEL